MLAVEGLAEGEELASNILHLRRGSGACTADRGPRSCSGTNHRRFTFQISSMSVPALRTTLDTGQKRRRSVFTFSMSDSLASVVTLMTEAPPRVEYELTPSALALRSVFFEEIMRWADEHAGALNLIADEAKQSDKQVRIGRRTS